MSKNIALSLDGELIEWAEREYKKRGLGQDLGGAIPTAEDRIIAQIHDGLGQSVFDKARAAGGMA